MMPKKEKKIPDEFWRNRQWIFEHYNELARKFSDKWIAVFNRKVVASGDSISEVEKIAKKKVGEKCLPVTFIEKGVHIYANFFKVQH